MEQHLDDARRVVGPPSQRAHALALLRRRQVQVPRLVRAGGGKVELHMTAVGLPRPGREVGELRRDDWLALEAVRIVERSKVNELVDDSAVAPKVGLVLGPALRDQQADVPSLTAGR